MRYLIILLAILAASPAWAGQAAKRMMRVTGQSSQIAFTVNGYSGVSSDTPVDTGIESITTGAGNVTVYASCSTAGAFDESYVRLEVDGGYTELLCTNGASDSGTLSMSVTAAAHNIRVYGNVSGTGSFDGYTFRKPKP